MRKTIILNDLGPDQPEVEVRGSPDGVTVLVNGSPLITLDHDAAIEVGEAIKDVGITSSL